MWLPAIILKIIYGGKSAKTLGEEYFTIDRYIEEEFSRTEGSNYKTKPNGRMEHAYYVRLDELKKLRSDLHEQWDDREKKEDILLWQLLALGALLFGLWLTHIFDCWVFFLIVLWMVFLAYMMALYNYLKEKWSDRCYQRDKRKRNRIREKYGIPPKD